MIGNASTLDAPRETVRVDPVACTACGLCLITCPTGALVAAPKRPDVFDPRCIACWACIEVCPRDAIAAVEL